MDVTIAVLVLWAIINLVMVIGDIGNPYEKNYNSYGDYKNRRGKPRR